MSIFKNNRKILEAKQLTPDSFGDIIEWLGGYMLSCNRENLTLTIYSYEDILTAQKGDWILKGRGDNFWIDNNYKRESHG